MYTFTLAPHATPNLRILCLGAHSDDIEIGCGGSILRLIETYPNVSVTWVVFSACGSRKTEAQTGASLFLKNVGEKKVVTHEYRDGFFPYQGWEVKEYFEQLKKKTTPDLIFTHYRNDQHQDHRTINDLTWNTFRDHLILEYEILKYDDDLGNPNVFVQLDEAICRQKIDFLMQAFNTQQEKPWFKEETFLALMRLRGVQSRSPGGFAEAFYGRKVSIL